MQNSHFQSWVVHQKSIWLLCSHQGIVSLNLDEATTICGWEQRKLNWLDSLVVRGKCLWDNVCRRRQTALSSRYITLHCDAAWTAVQKDAPGKHMLALTLSSWWLSYDRRELTYGQELLRGQIKETGGKYFLEKKVHFNSWNASGCLLIPLNPVAFLF